MLQENPPVNWGWWPTQINWHNGHKMFVCVACPCVCVCLLYKVQNKKHGQVVMLVQMSSAYIVPELIHVTPKPLFVAQFFADLNQRREVTIFLRQWCSTLVFTTFHYNIYVQIHSVSTKDPRHFSCISRKQLIPPPQPCYGPFSGTTRVSWCQ